MGPMIAAARFLDVLRDGRDRVPGAGDLAKLGCRLHGSLALTGKGHATDKAVIYGFAGFAPDRFDAARARIAEAKIQREGMVDIDGIGRLSFDPSVDMVFDYGPPLRGHTNGMVLSAYDTRGALWAQETYYSIGGGFVVTQRELERPPGQSDENAPYPFATAAEMVAMADETGLSIAQMKRRNEVAAGHGLGLDDGLAEIWRTMDASITEGFSQDGVLPGGLNLRRRAKALHDTLQAERGQNLSAPHTVNDWLSAYAMAVNEVNAAGGQVVTAPTNGAAGVVPSVLKYYLDHVPGASQSKISEFLLTAAAIGGLLKTNASISGAEVGCQGEVGSAAAMAAAGLCAVLGGTAQQLENAAEIALEHHLGMTCDPIAGLVQAPCIERNGLGAIKAVAAASLALRGDGQHLVSLDACIETMRQTGRDMHAKYKETSLGGLAVNLPDC